MISFPLIRDGKQAHNLPLWSMTGKPADVLTQYDIRCLKELLCRFGFRQAWQLCQSANCGARMQPILHELLIDLPQFLRA